MNLFTAITIYILQIPRMVSPISSIYSLRQQYIIQVSKMVPTIILLSTENNILYRFQRLYHQFYEFIHCNNNMLTRIQGITNLINLFAVITIYSSGFKDGTTYFVNLFIVITIYYTGYKDGTTYFIN